MLVKLFTRLSLILKNARANRRINDHDIMIFMRQFATLIKAGVPMIKSFDILEKSQEKNTLRLLIYTIKREMLTGKNLYFSLQQHPRYFDDLTCQLIKMGEHTGKLDTILILIANTQEKKFLLNKKLKQTLFYPAIVSLMAIFMVVFMFTFIIPRFAELFSGMENKLPAYTIWLFSVAKLSHYFIWLSILILMMISLSLRFYLKINLKQILLQFVNKLPLMKFYLQKLVLANFARQLALTFAAGLPINEALNLTASSALHPDFIHVFAKLRSKINAGLQIHHAMESLASFPPFMIQMVKIGEESGMLEPMLNKVADFFDAEIEQMLSYASKLLEPLIMIILGALIGGLVIGMYLPIFKLGAAI